MTKALFHLRQFRLLLLFLLCALFSLPLSAQEAYIEKSKDQHTLTFYYDNNRKGRSGETWGINEKSSSSTPVWAGTYGSPNDVVTKVVFDASFKDFRPTTTKYWFYDLSALTTIEGLENLNTSEVTDMSGMFSGCSHLKDLNVSNFNTSKVTSMSWIFAGCSGLTSLNVSNFNTSKVTDMGSMFSRCSSLTELNLSNFNTSEVTSMNSMFSRCSDLKELNVSNFNTSAVTSMNSMFSGCSGLKELNLSNFNTSKVTNMNSMLSGCSGLKTIFNTQTWRCKQSYDMFKGCTQLRGAVKFDSKRLDVTMANPETGYFRDPNKKYLEAYVLQSEDQHTLTFYYDNNLKLRNGEIWDIDEKSSSSKPVWAGTYSTPNYAVTKVVFDTSFKDFRPTTTEGWFYRLSELTTIEGLENLNTSAVTNMSGMFSHCSSLTSLNLSNFNTSAVTNMSEMFSDCSSLTSLNLSNFNTSKVTDMSRMFSGCSGLNTIFNTQTWRCKESEDMFDGCTQLKGAVKYGASKVDVTMANPTTGYFTDPNRNEAYVQQSEDKQTLTFYYDNNRYSRSGKIWDIDEESSSSEPAWAGTYNTSNKAVTNVVFDASFKNFRPTTTNSWFSHLEALTTIEGLENLNTSAVTNMSWMFSDCSGLTSLNLSNFNTSAVTDMSYMFYGCSNLTSLNLSNFNTSVVTDMRWMFKGCSSLTSLNLSNFNTSKVTDMSYMFYDCSGLMSLNVSSFNTSKVTDMSYMFYHCSGLTSLNVSSFNTSAVTDMNGMFAGCSSLTELNVSNFNTSAVTDMNGMFYGCSGLTSLNLSNFNTSAVKDMSAMFSGCSGLTSLNLSNFNTSVVLNMSSMFSGCSGLKTILNPNTWQRKYSQDMFKGCTQLKGAVKYDENELDVTMANPTTGYFTDLNPRVYVCQSEDQHTLTFYYDNNRKLRSGKTWGIDEKSSSFIPAWAGTNIYPDNVVTEVVFDASFKDFRPTTTYSWFSYFKALTTIEGLENLNTSEVTDMRYMFEGCSRLTSLNLSNFNTSKVTNMSDMFYGCSGLKELNVSNFSTSKVTNMSSMFSWCSSLTELNLSNFNTSAVTNMSWMFYACSRLTELNVSNFNTSKVTDMLYMFEGCSGLTELNLSSFNTEAVTNMFGMFEGGSSLTFLNLSNFNTSAVTEMRQMFCGCSSLRELNVSNFNTSEVTDMSNMFSDCSGLKELNVSNFNTSAVKDMSGMFYRCSSLTELNVSNFNTSAVKDMSRMFYRCSRLKTILNPNTWRCEKSQDMFKGCTQLKGAVKYDENAVYDMMANPTTGYFSQKLPSAIGRVVFDDNNATQIYNLQGKRVNANQRHLPAGFYIVNGKKVYLNEKP